MGPGGPTGPGGPYGPGGPGGPGGPYGSYGPGPQDPPPPRKRSKLPIVLVAVAVALALVVTAIVFAVRRGTEVVGQPPSPPPTTEPAPPTTEPPSDPPTDPPTPDPSTPTDPPATPAPPAGPRADQAVNGFLRAVASTNADLALRYAARPVPRDPTLSNAVLRESQRRAPLSRITVAPVTDPNATQVRASYYLGTTPVNTVYDVVKVGSEWKLAKVVNDLSLGAVRHSTVPMKINGATVTRNTIRVLPGSYAFTTGSNYLTYGNRNVLLVRSPTELVSGVFGLRRQLTTGGVRKVRSEAKASFDKCLDSRNAKPSNCPFRWTNSTYRYVNGTVNWKQSGDPFKKAKILLDGTRGPALSMSFKVQLSGNCRFQGQRGTCRGTVTGTAVGKIDLTRKPLKFDWL